jgi:hypothetical protein
MNRTIALLTAIVALAGCATTSLRPAPEAATLPGTLDVATDRVDGVTITVDANAWPGPSSVEEAVQPVLVTVDNDGSSAIRVRYSDFALVGPGGHRHAALPPFRVEGAVASPVLVGAYIAIGAPRFRHRRFYVAPYFGPLYPGIPVYRRPYYFYDPFYYGFYFQYFPTRPHAEMLSHALPEGVIEPGGSVSGFLYFERVDPHVPRVTFRANLVSVGDSAHGGAMFGEISIPFTVTTTEWP